jgi:RND family efflux transporter MFP subunit
MQSTHWHPFSVGGVRRFLFGLGLSAGLALVGLTSGCNRPSGSTSDQAATPAGAQTAEVKVVKPEKKDVRRLIERPGFNIEAYEHTLLYAKIAGYVQKWNFDMGARVKGPKYDSGGKLIYPGDILAEIYIPELEVELDQQEAAIEEATSKIQQAKAAKLRAEAELKRADSQYQRMNRLSGALEGKDQVEEYRLGFEAAQAALANAEADISVAEARLKRAKADRDHVKALLQYTKVRAPYDGVVTRRIVHTGDFVQPAGNGKGEALFIMEKVDPVRVFTYVQELETVWVRDGDTAIFRPQSLQWQPFKGTVARTSGSVDPETRTLRTEIDLPNPAGPNGERKLQPGMYGKVTIIAEHKNVWALPVAAIVTKGEQSFCYRVENGKAVRTPVQIGLRGNEQNNELVEVVKKQTKTVEAGEETRWEDFTGEEVIVTSDPASLTEGQAVSEVVGKK